MTRTRRFNLAVNLQDDCDYLQCLMRRFRRHRKGISKQRRDLETRGQFVGAKGGTGSPTVLPARSEVPDGDTIKEI
jgi:hypothetical protein